MPSVGKGKHFIRALGWLLRLVYKKKGKSCALKVILPLGLFLYNEFNLCLCQEAAYLCFLLK